MTSCSLLLATLYRVAFEHCSRRAMSSTVSAVNPSLRSSSSSASRSSARRPRSTRRRRTDPPGSPADSIGRPEGANASTGCSFIAPSPPHGSERRRGGSGNSLVGYGLGYGSSGYRTHNGSAPRRRSPHEELSVPPLPL